MQVLINGDERSLSDGTTVQALVGDLGLAESGRGVAVAVDGEVVPRSQWPAAELAPGMRIEVLIAVQGG